MTLSHQVQAKLQELPDKPGVYIMRDRNGRVIYVGKAVSLRKRVRTYFRKGTLRSADPKLRGLIGSIESFDFLVVRNEAEATLTEGRLIKEYKPRYNVSFRDDKRFLLLRVNLNDPFPRLAFCRIQKDDGATYFGPYASSGAVRACKAFMEKTFGLRACRPRRPGPEDHKHCINDIVRYCSAPCIGKVDAMVYLARVEEACAFLRGERPDILKQLEEAMNREAEQLRFERAAELRDTLLLIRKTLKQRASGRSSFSTKVKDAGAGVGELQRVLGLDKPPEVIECFDISNISGTHAVASMVCSVHGMPQRNRYRHFRIKTVEGSDDPAMIAEAVRRRYRRLVEEGRPLPDLVLVDGGITQLRAARTELAALGLGKLPSAGLAKRFEEIYWGAPGRERPILLPRNAPALRMLQRIRDEAHRFALTHHRKLREKRIRDSALDDVPGIGKERKEQLLAHFGSLARLKKAGWKGIAELPGFGETTARRILHHLE